MKIWAHTRCTYDDVHVIWCKSIAYHLCIVISLSGDAPPIEADELFSATHQSAMELLSQQSVVYEQEEHALRVLMEEELNEKMAREKARRGKTYTNQQACLL